MPKLLTPDEAAELLGISTKTLSNWRWCRCGPRFLRLGRRVLYSPEHLNDWLEEVAVQTHPSTARAKAPGGALPKSLSKAGKERQT